MKIRVTLNPSHIESRQDGSVSIHLEVPSFVTFPLLVLAIGYGLLWVSTWRGIDGDFFVLIGLASLVALFVSMLIHRVPIFGSTGRVLYYAFVFACAFPLARESTHYDPVQVPCTIVTSVTAIGLCVFGIVLKARRERQMKASFNGLCEECGYDLRASPSKHCPECGTPNYRLQRTGEA